MQSAQQIWSQESSQQPWGQNLTKSTYPPRKEAQSHPEGAPGSHANGEGMENSGEKAQGLCLLPGTNRCGKGVVSMLTVALQRQQNLEMAQGLLVQDLIDGLTMRYYLTFKKDLCVLTWKGAQGNTLMKDASCKIIYIL